MAHMHRSNSMTTLRTMNAAVLTAPSVLRCRLCAALLRARPWGGAECADCGSVNVSELPSRAQLAAFYGRYAEQYTGGGRSEGRNLERYARGYLARVQQTAKARRLIDVGSARSPFPALAAQAGFEVTVMDLVPPPDLPAAVGFVEGSLDDDGPPAFGVGRFDVVCAWAVMEHLPRPLVGARRLAALCAPGARLHLSMPESGSFITDHAIGRSPWFYPPEHLHLLSAEAVIRAFERLGLRRVRAGRFELNPWRHALRYGAGYVEAGVGLLLKTTSPSAWERLRDTRRQIYAGIACFEFERP